jgi:molybdopterin/thiamine biosynthesis adenylyltransferase
MTPLDSQRYSRQIRFPGLGEKGQERLLTSHVAIVGCGALGSFQAGAMARAGVGKLTIIDRDYVELSNLQRQWLFNEQDAEEALPKSIAASRAIRLINSTCSVVPQVADLTAVNIDDLLDAVDLILDGTDNFETRYLINDFAIRQKIPWIYGGAVGSYGVTMPIVPAETCCFRCVYPDPPSGAQPTCETAGVLNAITSAVASLQSAAAVKILAGHAVAAQITTIDIWSGVVRQVSQPEPDPACPACGRHEYEYLNGSQRAPISLCGRNAVQIHERSRPLDLERLKTELQGLGDIRANEFALRFFVAPYEMTIFADGRAIIKGTTDVGVARSLYSRYVGA